MAKRNHRLDQTSNTRFGGKRYQCYCGKWFNSMKELNEHIKEIYKKNKITAHKIITSYIDRRITLSGEWFYVCSCGKEFLSFEKYHIHQIQELNKKLKKIENKLEVV